MEFVVLKPSHKLAQIFTNYFGLNGVFLNDFTYLCLYALQKTFRVMTASNPHRHIKKTAALIFLGEAGEPRSIPQNGIPKSYQDGLYNCSLDKTGISKYVKDNYVINGPFFQKYWRKSGNRHYSAPIKKYS